MCGRTAEASLKFNSLLLESYLPETLNQQSTENKKSCRKQSIETRKLVFKCLNTLLKGEYKVHPAEVIMRKKYF